MSLGLINANVRKDTSGTEEIHVRVHALKIVFTENVARDLITNVFVIWDTLALIAIQTVDVMGIRLVIHSDPDTVTIVEKILKANFAIFALKAVLAMQPHLKVKCHKIAVWNLRKFTLTLF